jgi:thiamine biosynthesis lipoprotein
MGMLNHLVNAGGDIRTSGERGQGRPWTIAVEDPEKRGDYPEVVHVRNCAMATSGVYESFFDEKKIYNHLVSPRTGRSPRAVAGATVTAPTVMEADALSTSVCLMSPDKGIEFIYSLPGRECLILAASGRKMRSKGWNNGA